MNCLRPQGGGREGASELRKIIAEAHQRHSFQSGRRLSLLKSDLRCWTLICASFLFIAELLAMAVRLYSELPEENKNVGIREESANLYSRTTVAYTEPK